MLSNTEKFKAIVSGNKPDSIAKTLENVNNRKNLNVTQTYAFLIMDYMDKFNLKTNHISRLCDIKIKRINCILHGKTPLTHGEEIKLCTLYRRIEFDTLGYNEIGKIVGIKPSRLNEISNGNFANDSEFERLNNFFKRNDEN